METAAVQAPATQGTWPRRRRLARVLLWRWRHVAAAAALGAAALAAIEAARPLPPPTGPALVLLASRDAGALLQQGDVAVRPVPLALLPDGALDDPAQAVGARLAVGLPAGFPLAPGVLAGPGLAATAPAGTVVVPVRLADPDVARLLAAGDLVDLFRATVDGGQAHSVARDVLVMARSETDAGSLLAPATGAAPLVLVAVPREVATLLVGAGAWDPISAVLVAGGRRAAPDAEP